MQQVESLQQLQESAVLFRGMSEIALAVSQGGVHFYQQRDVQV